MAYLAFSQNGAAHYQSWPEGGDTEWEIEQLYKQCLQFTCPVEFVTVRRKHLTMPIHTLLEMFHFIPNLVLSELRTNLKIYILLDGCSRNGYYFSSQWLYFLIHWPESRQKARPWSTRIRSLTWSTLLPSFTQTSKMPRGFMQRRYKPFLYVVMQTNL